jgi:acyl dehydratase
VTDGDFTLDALGVAGPEHRFDVTADAISAYAAATDDDAPAARAGRIAPPVFAIVPVWDTIARASLSAASPSARKRVVHYAQDMHLAKPIEAGMTLVSRATPVALHARPNGTVLVIRTETRDDGSDFVNEQYVTEFFRGVEAPGERGGAAPSHRLGDDAKASDPTVELTYPVAEDQTNRYAAASGDTFAIHLDDEAARAVGLPGRILHGLCTMAFTGRAVLEAAGRDDPGAISRLAVRFSAPVAPGDAVTTRVWDLDNGSVFGYEALDSSGRTVIKDGRAELRA